MSDEQLVPTMYIYIYYLLLTLLSWVLQHHLHWTFVFFYLDQNVQGRSAYTGKTSLAQVLLDILATATI